MSGKRGQRFLCVRVLLKGNVAKMKSPADQRREKGSERERVLPAPTGKESAQMTSQARMKTKLKEDEHKDPGCVLQNHILIHIRLTLDVSNMITHSTLLY